ncbi:hypothetical protein LMG26788_03790 [Achromobacter pulmonis]|uniref:DUF2514 domain-containing protein n=1 Tax=Achromobacter pulmonis TaxID=1389932 RepID=A0A6S7E0U4_9BURK|nr:hypothetical protein [Achromobacter pulmonis]CAB3889970.1 hypothetical protein LMG26788_03724 [Achromobacter pulmonis]CAB3891305.1 hypothetical protein LMG26788_03790 [Achromobacter pulmonis]
MNPLLRMALPWIGGAAVVLVLGAGVVLYGASREAAGVAKERARAESAQRAITEAYQVEKDRADAQYRGAVLARQAAETTVAAQSDRIDGLLRQLAGQRAAAARARGGPDATGPDWIGIVGACVGEYERMGKDAARWADQVNGLQGYIRGLRGTKP